MLHGERVVVDTVSGNAHFDSNAEAENGSPAKPPGRVRAVILPNKDAKDTKGGSPNAMSIMPAGRLSRIRGTSLRRTVAALRRQIG